MAARAAAEARRAQRAEEERQAAHARSPLGRAQAATERGDRFLEIREDYSYISGAELEQIEDLGWRLEHVGYVFVQSGFDTTVDSSGDSTSSTRGEVQGNYLFRRTKRKPPSEAGDA